MNSAKHKASAFIVCLLVALMPFSFASAGGAAGSESGSGCTVQDRINWICRQGSDALSSCSAEWKMPEYSSELNELALLREGYGWDKLLKELDYKGDNYCPASDVQAPAAPAEEKQADSGLKKCTVQDRINWICGQSKDDESWSCTAEYKVSEYAAELNKLAGLREQHGGYALLESVGYEGRRECGLVEKDEKPAERRVKEEETGKGVRVTDTDSDGSLIGVVVEDGLIAECLRNGVNVNCPRNSNIPDDAFDLVGDDEKVVPNGASIGTFAMGLGTDLLYTPYSTPSVELSAFGEKGTGAALVLWLTDENGAKLFPLLVHEGTFGDSEGDILINEELSLFVEEGKYSLLAELWQDGLKRDEKYLLSGGVKTSIYILEKPEAIYDESGPTSEDVEEKLKAYLEARYSSPKSSEAYRKAFREFMEAYIKASFESENERNSALAALEEQNIDNLIDNTEVAFRKEMQAFTVETGLAASNVAYDETIALFEMYRNPPFSLSGLVREVITSSAFITSTLNLINNFPKGMDDNTKRLDDIRSAFGVIRNRMDSGEDYDSIYDQAVSGPDDNSALHNALVKYHSKRLFKAIRDNDAPQFRYELGKLYIHYAVYGFTDTDKLPLDDYEEEEKLYFSYHFGPYLAGKSEVNEKARNLISLGEDQFNIVLRLYPESRQIERITDANNNLKMWGTGTGVMEGVIGVGAIIMETALIFVGVGAVATSARVAGMLSKVPSVVSRLAVPGTRALMFSGAAFEGVQTIGGCIEFFANDAGKVSEAGAEYSKCYARAATTIVLTVAPAKLSAKSLKPVLQSAEETNVFRASAKSAANAGRAKPAAPSTSKVILRPVKPAVHVPNIKPTPAPKVSPVAAAEKAVQSVSASAETVAGSRHIGRQGQAQVVKKLETWTNSPRARAAMGDGRAKAVARVNEAKAKIKAAPSAVRGGGVISRGRTGIIEDSTFTRGKASGVVSYVGKGHGDDSIFIDGGKNLMVVADGVSISPDNVRGVVSSSHVVDILPKQYVSGTGSNGLASAIEKAHYTNPGGASTVVAASVDSNVLSVAWVGDSRLYVIRNKEITQLTVDHRHPVMVNEVTAAVGHNLPQGGVPTKTFQLQKGDVVLLSTDGLHDQFLRFVNGGWVDDPEQILRIVEGSKSKGPSAIRDALFQGARAAGQKSDDIGIIVHVYQ